MRRYLLLFFGLLSGMRGFSQGFSVAFDPQHCFVVIENQVVRSAAEVTHQHYLGKINDNLETVNTNVGSVVLAQTMIYNALANVNSALKNGLAVKQIGLITSDIVYYLGQATNLAKSDPLLLLTTSKVQNEMAPKAIALVNEISGFVLKEGDNVLMDYNSRDQLLRRIIQQLQILDGMAYGTWKTMFWASQRGVLRTLNPWQNYINKDRAFVQQIIRDAKYLNK